jgi:hypothetical protein
MVIKNGSWLSPVRRVIRYCFDLFEFDVPHPLSTAAAMTDIASSTTTAGSRRLPFDLIEISFSFF